MDPQGTPQGDDPHAQAAGQAGAQQAGGTQDGGQKDPKQIEQEVQQFLAATPPPEPRGSAYMDSDDFKAFATTVNVPEHPTTFQEKYFLYLFAGSLSLDLKEKKDILARIPSLTQFQMDELVKILEEEKQKFDQLEHKHPEQVKKLRDQAAKEWHMIEMESHKEETASQDTEAADEIRKSLGLE